MVQYITKVTAQNKIWAFCWDVFKNNHSMFLIKTHGEKAVEILACLLDC